MFSSPNETVLPLLTLTGKIALSLITISILLLGVYPGWLINIIMKFVAL
jgi:hypothetical protein